MASPSLPEHGSQAPPSLCVESLLSNPSSHRVFHPRSPSIWYELFKKSKIVSPSTTLSSYHPSFLNRVAIVPKSVFALGISKWQEYLVGFVLGKKLPFFLIRKEIERILNCNDSIELSGDKDAFFIRCKKLEHRQLLLDGGPLFVASRVIVLQAWSSAVEAKKDHLDSLPLWINLEIPRELWHPEGISFAASLFGDPLRMDDFTTNMSKTRFARVCVLINASFQFPHSILVNLVGRINTVKVDYKWKPVSCSKCLIFGHSEKNCSSVVASSLDTKGLSG